LAPFQLESEPAAIGNVPYGEAHYWLCVSRTASAWTTETETDKQQGLSRSHP